MHIVPLIVATLFSFSTAFVGELDDKLVKSVKGRDEENKEKEMEALEKRLKEKSAKFVEKGSEVYAKA